MRSSLRNVIQLSSGVVILFSSFSCHGFITVSVIKTLVKENPDIYKDCAYIALCLYYLSFMISCLFSAYIVSMVGSKKGLIFGSLCFTLYMLHFIFFYEYLYYALNILLGFSAAILWASQGEKLASYSNVETSERNTTVFMGITQNGILFGGIFMFIMTIKSNNVESPSLLDIQIYYIIFAAICLVGVLTFIFLPNGKNLSDTEKQMPLKKLNDKETEEEEKNSNIYTLIKIATKKEMITLIPIYLFLGVSLSFFSVVIPSLLPLSEPLKSYISWFGPLCCILFGAGQIFGSFTFSFISKHPGILTKKGKVLLSMICYLFSFGVFILYLPHNSLNGYGFLPPSMSILALANFIYGFSDAMFKTQVTSELLEILPKNGGEAFALFNFWIAAGAALSFLSSMYINFLFQCTILLGMLGITIISYIMLQKIKLTTRRMENE
uniref:Major facilitator superfamily (MFS) profile domain-containing protein n=1 Tax=Strongyloides stercoralis TaxID=6248 RepID=A0A0K0EI36_STRER